MDDESTRDEPSIVADKSTVDTNGTVENENHVGENEFLDKGSLCSATQAHSSLAEAQSSVKNTAKLTRQWNVTHLILYAVILLIGIALGV